MFVWPGMGLLRDEWDLSEAHQAVTLYGNDCYEQFLFFSLIKQCSVRTSRAAPHGVWRNLFSLKAALIKLVHKLTGFELSWIPCHDPLFCQGGARWN